MSLVCMQTQGLHANSTQQGSYYEAAGVLTKWLVIYSSAAFEIAALRDVLFHYWHFVLIIKLFIKSTYTVIQSEVQCNNYPLFSILSLILHRSAAVSYLSTASCEIQTIIPVTFNGSSVCASSYNYTGNFGSMVLHVGRLAPIMINKALNRLWSTSQTPAGALSPLHQ